MTDQNTPLPAAGWYPDPEDPAGERWWNGATWGEDRRAPAPAPPVAAPAFAPAAASPYVAPQPYVASGYGAPGYAPGYAAPSSTNGLAIAGLVVSAASVLIGIFGLTAVTGIILSVLGLSQATKRQSMGVANTGRGLALAGIIVGAVSLVLNIVYLVWLFNGGLFYSYY